MISGAETNEEYHSSQALSCSGLKVFAQSPYRFRYRPEPQATDAMTFGSLVHTMVLEPEKVAETYVVAPKVDRRTRAGKEEWQAFQDALLPGQEPVKADTYELAKTVADRAQPWAAEIRRSWGQMGMGLAIEHSVRTQTEYGVLQTRPDIAHFSEGRIWDLKTISSLSRLESQFWSMGYHLQDAFYRIVLEYELGWPMDPIEFHVVETEAPYETATVRLDPDTAALARHYVFGLLDRFRRCTDTDDWPGAYQGVHEMVPPGYLQKQLEESTSKTLAGMEALAQYEAQRGTEEVAP
mgnify:CR=1 FL=1